MALRTQRSRVKKNAKIKIEPATASEILEGLGVTRSELRRVRAIVRAVERPPAKTRTTAK